MAGRRPGGLFVEQDKRDPGVYYNIKAVPRITSSTGERGTLAIAMNLDWGTSGVQKINRADFKKNSIVLFGYPYEDEKLRPFREMFLGAKDLVIYRLNEGGEKATATVGKITAEAKYSGIVGNKLKIVVTQDIDTEKFIVETYYEFQKVDSQEVEKAEELKANKFITFKGTGALDQADKTAGTNLVGGANKESITVSEYQNFLLKVERESFDILAYVGIDESIKKLYEAFTLRMREEEGVLFQLVTHKADTGGTGNKAVMSLWDTALEDETALVYWLAGQEAGCGIANTLTNKVYDGEYTVVIDYSETSRETIRDLGHIMFGGTPEEPYIVEDVNTLREFTLDEPEDMSKNQVVRVLDQRVKGISSRFIDRYMGKVQNTNSARQSFWAECVGDAEALMEIGAIIDYDSEDTIVESGESKDAVLIIDKINPAMALQKLYIYVNVI